jgi:flagellar protein FlbD
MIKVSRINGKEFVVNADLVETLEATPDTVVTLTTGKKLMVKDTVDEMIKKIVDYKKEVHAGVTVIRKKEADEAKENA